MCVVGCVVFENKILFYFVPLFYIAFNKIQNEKMIPHSFTVQYSVAISVGRDYFPSFPPDRVQKIR